MTSSCAMPWMRRKWQSAGGPVTRITGRLRSMRMHTPRRKASQVSPSRLHPVDGMTRSANTFSTGRTPERATTRMPWPSNLRIPCFVMPVRSANGICPCWPAWRDDLPRWSDEGSGMRRWAHFHSRPTEGLERGGSRGHFNRAMPARHPNEHNTPENRQRARSRVRTLTRTAILAATGATALIGVAVSQEHPGVSATSDASQTKSTSSATSSTSTTTSTTSGSTGSSDSATTTTTTVRPTTTTTTTRPVVTSGGTSR